MKHAGRFLNPLDGECPVITYSAPIQQNIVNFLIKPVLCSLLFVLLGAGFVVAAEIDDSSLFIEAFSAYQKKDYLLAIEKIGVMEQLFPDTPLRDVALLLLARSGIRSGDNDLAATAVNRFNSEFATNPLKPAIEEELLRLGIRRQNGEKLPPAIALQTAARKVRDEQAVLERTSVEKSGQPMKALEKTGAEKRERLALQTSAQENTGASIHLQGGVQIVAAGQRGEIPFEAVNPGTSDDNFVLETVAPPEYETTLRIDGRADEGLSRVTIGTTASLKGSIKFRMPHDRIDGHKAAISLRIVSGKSPRTVTARETRVITAAPLVRVVAKPEKQRIAPGERTRYRITVLNAGTLPAVGMTVRVRLPVQAEPAEPAGTPYLRDAAGCIVFEVDTLGSGKLSEFILDVKVREDSPVGQELHLTVEVVNNQLQTKEIFNSAAVVVQGNRPLTAPLQRP